MRNIKVYINGKKLEEGKDFIIDQGKITFADNLFDGDKIKTKVAPTYFQRLKQHPGINYAILFTIMGALAGGANKNFAQWWQGALFGIIIMGGFCWGAVLISNIKKNK